MDGLELGDDAYTLFFSTVGTKEKECVEGTGEGGVSGKLKELLRYMNDTKGYPVGDSDNELVKRIDAAVVEAKMDSEWRRAYMTYQARIWDAEDAGEERGRAEGRAEGEEKKARETAKKLYQRGDSPADIADIVGYAVEKVEQWLGLVTV